MRFPIFPLILAGVLLPLRGAAEPEPLRFNINLKGIPLPEALRQVCASGGMKLALSADLKLPELPIDLNIRDLPSEPALRAALRVASDRDTSLRGLVAVRKGDTLSLEKRPVEGIRIEIPLGAAPGLDSARAPAGPVQFRVTKLEVKPSGARTRSGTPFRLSRPAAPGCGPPA
jgi:hypothetical protein